MYFLGIDTSNYATSLAIFDSSNNSIIASQKLMLTVKTGQLGLRQSDAVFEHTKNISKAFHELYSEISRPKLSAIGVSTKPRDINGSYMPCFLVGQAVANSIAQTLDVPIFEYSHQAGHIMAALLGTGFATEHSLEFLAFHVSGGTTDALDCKLNRTNITISQLASSLDLFAGQAVDRVGALLGLNFPSGSELSQLAKKSNSNKFLKPVLKGANCCLSGLENKCKSLFAEGVTPENVARYCLLSIAATIEQMILKLNQNQPNKKIIFAGGVLSSDVIRADLSNKFKNAYFCKPASLSSDNAVGVAVLAAREMEQ